MNTVKVKFTAMSFQKIMDELEFVQRVMELYDIPEHVATKITEHLGGMLEKYEEDMLELLENSTGDGFDVSEYLDSKDECGKVGGITRV